MLSLNNMDNNNKSFSEKFSELEKIYQKIKDTENQDLDVLIDLYQKGIALSKTLENDIQKFEQKINTITLGISEDTMPEDTIENSTEASNSDTVDSPPNVNTQAMQKIDGQKRTSSKTSRKEESSNIPDTSSPTISREYITDLFSEE